MKDFIIFGERQRWIISLNRNVRKLANPLAFPSLALQSHNHATLLEAKGLKYPVLFRLI
jgi:hypothetical protein